VNYWAFQKNHNYQALVIRFECTTRFLIYDFIMNLKNKVTMKSSLGINSFNDRVWLKLLGRKEIKNDLKYGI